MNIQIKRLELTNFKCFRHKEISFDSDITTIRGRNGVGKTTIADAILWCLFGKNSAGQSDFDLKTHDPDGRPIPNLDHSVEMVLTVLHSFANDQTVTLKRTLKETWVKRRGSDEQVFKNNTTEYLIDGEVKTAADYKKFISELVNEDIFRAITNPSYFPSLKWQQQREFLTKMVGYIAPEEIATTDELADLVKSLPESNKDEGIDIIAHRKHLSYQIKQIKDKLDKIPVRLEEQNKALPERLDWDALKMELEKAQKELNEVDKKILAIKAGNGDEIKRAEIRQQLSEHSRKLSAIESHTRQFIAVKENQKNQAVAEAQQKFNSLVTTQRDLESQLQSFDTLIKRIKEQTDIQYRRTREMVRAAWPRTQEEFNIEENGLCSLCHQPLPAEMMDKAKEEFNINKAKLKAKLTQQANEAKQLLVDAEKEVKDYETKKAEAEKNLADIKEQINVVFSDKAKLEKESVLSYEQELAESKEYQALLQDRDELQKKLDSVGIDEEATKQLADLEAQKVQYAAVIQQQTTLLATRTQYDKILALIDGINEEQKDLVRQLSELERKEDIARQYQDRQNAILEERINEHFSLVKWRMFRTVNNGGDPFDEPFCECYVDGVAYHDGLNQAARLNAGLDIINALCKHYNVFAPIVIDNSESNLNILTTESQQVRLEVFDSDLQIV
ncbi:MAG: AAA family ATPase [Prevotella sp.]|nr:AAA family ATPase [Prevotella sp.]